MRTAELVVIRHGESEWNAENLFCGWYDASLSEKGLKDALTISAAALKEHNLRFDCAFASALKRSQQTLKVILEDLQCPDLPTICDWRLNERHYGNLIGFNKRAMADKYGIEQVQKWRRSFDVCPPPITPENPYYESICSNPSFADIPPDQFPYSESLKIVMGRVIPFYETVILDRIGRGESVLVVVHGTVARGLIKHIEQVSDENIATVNVPNSIPCLYTFDVATRRPTGMKKFLADENFLNRQMEKTASIGK